MRKWVFIGCFALVLSCSQGAVPFDPKNENQVVEIYVRTNFYNDFKVFEKYRVEGEKALAYSRVIQDLEKDIGQWDNFMKKAERYREKIRKEYFPKNATDGK